MEEQFLLSVQVLEQFIEANLRSPAPVDRDEVVAHAFLSALLHHWPSRVSPSVCTLLQKSGEIVARERSRWMTQRRIAIAKIHRNLTELGAVQDGLDSISFCATSDVAPVRSNTAYTAKLN